MYSHIKKRNGEIVLFDEKKITAAIAKAGKATKEFDFEEASKLMKKVIAQTEKTIKNKIPQVEQIQDIVENVLLNSKFKKTAKAYILYREQHKKLRDITNAFNSDLVDKYLREIDWQVKENSNMSYSLQGLNNYLASELSKTYWLNKIYPREIENAHLGGDFHIHDLGMLSVYCVGWDLQDLLLAGFKGVSGKTESRPAKHFRAALGQAVNFMYTLQGEAAGAQAFSNFDTLLSPFIRYDNLSYEDVKQAMQEFIFNMNVPTRVGFQTPYTNLTFDLVVPKIYADQGVIIGGKVKEITYQDFQKEMDMLNKAFLEVMSEGDAKGRVFTFPIPTYNITKDFDWDNPIVDLLDKVTAKYGLPYFSNFVSSDMKPDDVRSMCKLPTTQIIYKNAAGEIAKTEIRKIVDNFLLRDNSIKILINGEFKPVKDVIKLRLENKEIIKITLDNGIIDKMTLDHPSLVIKDGEIKIKASDKLRVGDEFPFSKNPYKGELGDFDLGRLIGLYAGGGWISYNGATANFIFNEKEKILVKFIKEITEKRFAAIANIFSNRKHHHSKISIVSKGVVEIIKEYIRGDDALNKRLNSNLFARCSDFRKGVLIGIIESDGLVNKKKNQAVLSMGNKNLILDIFILSRSLGINATFYETQNMAGEKKKIGYNLSFSAGNSDWFAKYFGLKKGKNQKYKEYKNFYGVRIIKVEKEKYTGYVYDFELDSKEHSFQLANGIITHNCCRLRLDLTELRKRGGGYFGANPLTGSIGVVTINMPRLGYLSKDENEFIEKLNKIMNLAKESLEIKRKVLERLTDGGLYPYTKFYLRNIKKRFNEYWKNHFSTIGLLGMNEACLNLFGKNIGSPEGQKFSIKVLDFMRDKMLEFQKETGNIYNIEATPAEGTSYRLALKDKKKNPNIICANEEEYKEGAEPFYTNSSQLPVNFTDDIFETLDLQDSLQTKYTGGCIEGGNKVLTNKGLLDIKYIVKNFDELSPIKALSYNPKNKVSEWDKIIKAIKVNVKKHNKIKILGERNLAITTSDWHPFFVMEEVKIGSACPICGKNVKNIKGFANHLRWNSSCREKYYNLPKYQIIEKRADELNGGDYLLQNSNNAYPNKKTRLTNELMWLIGFFISGGYILKSIDNKKGNNLEKYTVSFFSKHKKPLEKIVGILNKHFECKVKISSKGKKSALTKEVSTSKKQAIGLFFKYGFSAGKKAYDVYVPQKVKENINKENVYALFSGLIDSNSSIGKRDGDFEYATVSQKLADDVLEMLVKAGILASKKLKKTKRNNGKNIYRIRVPQYEMAKIKDKLDVTVNPQRIKNSLSNKTKRYLPAVRVKKISKVNMEDNQFYDLMTAKNHNYLAGNNCLVFIHNTTIHLFLGEKINDPTVVKRLVKKICEKYRLPYFTITPTFSICPVHGYVAGEHYTCPKCGEECEVYSRSVGYLRPVKQWNKGKKEEFKERKTFKI